MHFLCKQSAIMLLLIMSFFPTPAPTFVVLINTVNLFSAPTHKFVDMQREDVRMSVVLLLIKLFLL